MKEETREHFLDLAEGYADEAYRLSEGIEDPQTLLLMSIARSLLVIADTAPETA